jgi:hypothetical protein
MGNDGQGRARRAALRQVRTRAAVRRARGFYVRYVGVSTFRPAHRSAISGFIGDFLVPYPCRAPARTRPREEPVGSTRS